MLFLSFRPGTTRRVNQLQTEHKQRNEKLNVNEKKSKTAQNKRYPHWKFIAAVNRFDVCDRGGREKDVRRKMRTGILK